MATGYDRVAGWRRPALPPSSVRRPRAAAFRHVWWANPFKFVLYFLAPVFLLSVMLAAGTMSDFGSVDFLDAAAIWTGVGALAALLFGIKAGQLTGYGNGTPLPSPDFGRLSFAMSALTIILLISHLVLFGALILNPAVIAATLSGDRGAIYQSKEQLTSVLGITSLVNLTPVVLAIGAYLSVHTGRMIRARYAWMIPLLIVFVLMRAFLAAERFAIIEAAVGYALPFVTFRARRIPFLATFPLYGFLGVLIIFAIGEYTRSWPYYIDQYDNFLQFVPVRLLGYIAVASNTGAGVLDTTNTIGYPYLTAVWFRRLFGDPEQTAPTEDFFYSFGNAEYNNPGGLFAGFIDFGLPLGLVYYTISGFIVGYMYARCARRDIFAVMVYPLMYLGVLILIQAVYWGDPKFVTPFFGSVLIYFFVRSRKADRAARP